MRAKAKRTVHRVLPASQILKEGMWAGEPAFIIGGGPSLKGFPFKRLIGKHVIACNRAHECGVAEMIVTGDRRWLRDNAVREDIDPNLPIVYAKRRFYRKPLPFGTNSLNTNVYVMDCCNGVDRMWGRTLQEGVSPGDTGIRAANLAAILGADPIYLLGIDMGGGTGTSQAWWHLGYSNRVSGWYEDFLTHWNKTHLSGQIEANVINLSLKSNLKCFPFQDWREVIY